MLRLDLDARLVTETESPSVLGVLDETAHANLSATSPRSPHSALCFQSRQPLVASASPSFSP